MGTNYYFSKAHVRFICPNCDHELQVSDRKHLGKLSKGLKFVFNGSGGVEAWLDLRWSILDVFGEVFDEYGNGMTPEDFIDMVQQTKHLPNPSSVDGVDPDGWPYIKGHFS